MSALSVRHFQQAQVLTAISKHRYLLTERASAYHQHQHVWLARSQMDGGQFIIKSPLRAEDSEQRKAMRQLDTEMTILKGPLKDTEGIRQLVDQIVLGEVNEQTRAGVFEYLDFDLHKYYLTQKHQFSRLQIKSIARQILKALSNTHKQDIVHTDLKPDNIVFSHASSTTSEILVKIIDFGVASQRNEDRCRMITNPYWRSPESWVGIPWGTPADIWSFGAIIGSLLMEPGAKLFQPMGGLAGVPTEEQDREFLRSLWTIVPFPKTFLDRVPKKWQDDISRFSPRLAPTGVPITLSFIGEIFEVPQVDWEFVRDILQVDPNMRPTADELLQHNWLYSS
ncbi:kinase-like domain-containing protein [Leptodontidium sp. MPI-SDFR-AT-0119]|nr:kinase-like domain-containing protein [Leptodontidium sp. MPI-SDFR-AT-0119]